jgi:hypothetical protein
MTILSLHGEWRRLLQKLQQLFRQCLAYLTNPNESMVTILEHASTHHHYVP